MRWQVWEVVDSGALTAVGARMAHEVACKCQSGGLGVPSKSPVPARSPGGSPSARQ